MNTQTTSTKSIYSAVLALLAGIGVAGAQTSAVWTNNTYTSATGYRWSNPANWTNSAGANVVPGGNAATADFSMVGLPVASSNTMFINLDLAETLGSLLIGNTNASPSNAWFFGSTNGSVLSLNTGSATVPNISLVAGTTNELAIPIASTNGVAYFTTGTLQLADSGVYSGPTTISNSGSVQLLMPPVLYYSWQEKSGLSDGSLVTNQGTGGAAFNGFISNSLSGSVTIVPGAGPYGGNALSINSGSPSNGYVQIPAPGPYWNGAGDANWSVALWAKTSQQGGVLIYQGHGLTNGAGGWLNAYDSQLMLQNNTNLASDTGLGSNFGGVSDGRGFFSGTNTVSDGNWHFLVVSVRAGVKNIYVDGNLDSVVTASGGWTTNGTGTLTNSVLLIGGGVGGNDGGIAFNGFIGDVYVYNRGISQAEARMLMNNVNGLVTFSVPIPYSSPLTMATNSRIDLNGNNWSDFEAGFVQNDIPATIFLNLSGGGTIDSTLPLNNYIFVSNSAPSTFAGLIPLSAAATNILYKIGVNTNALTFTGTNLSSGGTIVDGGVLTIGSKGLLTSAAFQSGANQPTAVLPLTVADSTNSAVLNILTGGVVNAATTSLGTHVNGGAGAIYNNGGYNNKDQVGVGSLGVGSSSAGTNSYPNGYGYFLEQSGIIGLGEVGIGGFSGGDGVYEVAGGTTYFSNYLTIGRSTGFVGHQDSLVLIRNGTLYAPDYPSNGVSGGTTMNWGLDGILQNSTLDVGAGGIYTQLGVHGGIVMNCGPTFYAPSITSNLTTANASVTISTNGSLTTGNFRSFIYPGGHQVVNINGGKLAAITATNNFFDSTLGGVYVYGGGATFNTAPAAIGTSTPLSAPTGYSVTSIPLISGGAGYIGRPIVHIIDNVGGGFGATAVAEWNITNGTITGITVTSPGTAYVSGIPPTVALIGGGYSTPAVLGTPTLAPAVTNGPVNIIGGGTMSFLTQNSTVGPINVIGSTAVFSGGNFGLAGPVTAMTNGNLLIDDGTSFYGTPVVAGTNGTITINSVSGSSTATFGALTIVSNGVLDFNYGPMNGVNPTVPTLAVTGDVIFNPGSVINITGTSYGLVIGTFHLIQYGTLDPSSTNASGILNASLVNIPVGMVAVLTNNAVNHTLDIIITGTPRLLLWQGVNDSSTPDNLWNVATDDDWIYLVNSTGPVTFNEYSTTNYGLVGDLVTFNDNLVNNFVNPPSTNVSLSGRLTPLVITVNNGVYPYEFTGSGGLDGIGTLLKTNASTLGIYTSNDYSGGTFLGGGMTTITNDDALGTNTGLVSFSAGGELSVISGPGITSSRPFGATGPGTFSDSPTGTSTLSGVINTSGNPLSFDSPGGTTTLSGNSNNIVLQANNGTLIMSPTFRNTNTTTVNSSSIAYGSGIESQTADVVMQSGSVWQTASSIGIGDLGTSYLPVQGRLDINGGNLVFANSGALLYVGKVSGATGLVYQTAGTVTMNLGGANGSVYVGGNGNAAASDNGYAAWGGYYLSGGTLNVSNQFRIGANGYGELYVTGTGVLNFSGSATYLSVGRALNGAATDYQAHGTMVVGGGGVVNMLATSILAVGYDGPYGYPNVLTISNGGTIYVTNTSSMVITADNTTAGATASGVVNLETNGLLIVPSISAPGAAANFGSGSTANLNLDGGFLRAAGSSLGFINGPIVVSVMPGGAIIDTTNLIISFTNALVNGTGGGADGGLVKLGTGLLTLNGSNSYTGATVISNGEVILANINTAPGGVTVTDGAAFGIKALTNAATAMLGNVTLGSLGQSNQYLDFSYGTNLNTSLPLLHTPLLTLKGTNTIRLGGSFTNGQIIALVQYGSITGTGYFLPTAIGTEGFSGTVTTNGNIIQVQVTSLGSPIVWTGTNSAANLTNLWTVGTATNWLLGSTPVVYTENPAPGDAVIFNDNNYATLGAAYAPEVVHLSNIISPTSITISNSTSSYLLNGTGSITGPTGLVKSGTNIFTNSLAGNTYTGNTIISNGMYTVGSTTTIPFGPGAGDLYVYSNATPVGTVGSLNANNSDIKVNGLIGNGIITNSGSSAAHIIAVNTNFARVTNLWAGSINRLSLEQVGPGTLIVSGSNNLSGTFDPEVGILGTLILTNGGVLNCSATEEIYLGEVAPGVAYPAILAMISSSNFNGYAGILHMYSNTVVRNTTYFEVGRYGGQGTVIMDGGLVTHSGSPIELGSYSPDYPSIPSSIGLWIMNAGGVQSSTGVNVSTGYPGFIGTLIMNGGQWTNTGSLAVTSGSGTPNAIANVYLNGGLFSCSSITGVQNDTSSVFFNGGTLQAQAGNNVADWITLPPGTTNANAGLDNAYVSKGGLIFNANGLNITIGTTPSEGSLLANPNSPGGGLTNIGAGTLLLMSPSNTYTGTTVVSNGNFGGMGEIAGPLIIWTNGNLAPGPLFSSNGVGTFQIAGPFAPGSIGSSPQPLTLQGKATFRLNNNLSGATNDEVAGISGVTYGGTLVINNVTNANTVPLTAGEMFQLFYGVSGAPPATGNFTGITGTPGPGLAYQFNPSTGILSVIAVNTSQNTGLTFTGVSKPGSALTISWPSTSAGWILQSQTDTVNQGIRTNDSLWIDVAGSEGVTQEVITIGTTNSVFFRQRYPTN